MTRTELTEKVNAYREKLNAATETLTDEAALETVALFPAWVAGAWYDADKRIRHGGKLYRVRQGHTAQDIYQPGATGTESLYAEVCETHAGTLEDPIPYEGNMELTEGLYYSQNGVTYLCTRSSGQPVYHALSELVGLYVEVAV